MHTDSNTGTGKLGSVVCRLEYIRDDRQETYQGNHFECNNRREQGRALSLVELWKFECDVEKMKKKLKWKFYLAQICSNLP
jgi:hypothetical protein